MDTGTLDQVRRAWAEVLDVEAVPEHANFFEAGGDSLLLIVLLDRLNALTDRDLDAADLFQHSTIRAQAALLDAPDSADSPRAAVELGAINRRGLIGRAQRTGQEVAPQ